MHMLCALLSFGGDAKEEEAGGQICSCKFSEVKFVVVNLAILVISLWQLYFQYYVCLCFPEVQSLSLEFENAIS